MRLTFVDRRGVSREVSGVTEVRGALGGLYYRTVNGEEEYENPEVKGVAVYLWGGLRVQEYGGLLFVGGPGVGQ